MSWSHTLQLPRSALANRSSAALISANLPRVTTDLYRWQAEQMHRPTKVLHDGPPYANGDLHMGHALNKVLKDIINRYAVSSGFRVAYRPGWDCHGLPIEHTALKKAKQGGRGLSSVQRRALARKLAEEMVAKQKDGFVSFGVMADWDSPSERYLTLSSDYVIRELRVFAALMSKGLVFRQRKPVFWSVDSATALAESELVYGERDSPATYLTYALTQPFAGLENVCLSVWTTTPWTLPANQAVAVNNDISYCIVQHNSRTLLVAEALTEQFAAALGANVEVVARGIRGSELVGLKYTCPLRGRTFPVIAADHVVESAGTGLVHTAPGHGKEDFVAGQKNGLLVFSPVDGHGRYTSEIELPELVGLDARKEGSAAVLNILQAKEALLATHKITHSVPLDWRTKTPVMVRATPQFFIDLGPGVRGLALKALDKVSFRPESGKHRLQAFTESRTDWCISRQRAWGVPIPVVYEKGSDNALISAEAINHIINRIEQLGENGLSLWFEDEADIDGWLPKSMQGQELGTKFYKGRDTLDVWLDSGSSWTMLKDVPVDIYLEGSDQHRGWFQSSLLTHVAVTGRAEAPFKRLITHGFVLDENRQKMSKSVGNTVEPLQLIKTLGIDGLRLLIAQSDYTSDISLSTTSSTQVAAMVKKFRLTFKYLLGNLAGYEGNGAYDAAALSILDIHALHKLNELVHSVREAFEEQNFQHVVKLVQAHMNHDLSSVYFDAVKDTLYTDAVDAPRRRAVQHVLWHVLDTYVRLMAPITPLLTQEVWDLCPSSITASRDDNKTPLSSPLMAGFPVSSFVEGGAQASEMVANALTVRDVVNEAIEQARAAKSVGSSLACDIFIEPGQGTAPEWLARTDPSLLETLCIASSVSIDAKPPKNAEWVYISDRHGIRATIVPPSNHKCPRCWKFTSPEVDKLCHRCDAAVHN